MISILIFYGINVKLNMDGGKNLLTKNCSMLIFYGINVKLNMDGGKK